MNPTEIKDFREYVGLRIRHFRESSTPRMSQVELSDELNVQKTTVSQYENGAILPPLTTIIDLTRIFGVTLDQFLEFDYDPDWFKTPKNNAEWKEEEDWVNTSRHIFRSVNPEGKKLLKEMAKFVYSRYKLTEEEVIKAITEEENRVEAEALLSED